MVQRSLKGRSHAGIADVEDSLFVSASVATNHLELSWRNLEGDEARSIVRTTLSPIAMGKRKRRAKQASI